MKTDYTRYYRKWHSDTEQHRTAMMDYYGRLLSGHLPEDRRARILDVGCGMGFTLLTLKDLGFTDVAGVESDQGQVDSCRAKHLKVELSEDTIAFLKSSPTKYDLIISLDVIEHIPVISQLPFVDAIAGALVPGGRFICTVPNANSVIAERWRYNDWTHHSSFTEHSLDFLLFNGGFEDIRIEPIEFNLKPKMTWLPKGGVRHWWAFRFVRLWRRLEMMAELGPAQGRTVPLSLNIMAVSRKAD